MANYISKLKTGQIVHFDVEFHKFIRCEIVLIDNKNKLKPIALVGNWNSKDSHYYNKELFESYDTCIYESDNYAFKDPEYPDPRTLTAINLPLRPLTLKQKREAKFYRAIREVCVMLSSGSQNSDVDPEDLLKQTNKYIENILYSK